LIGAVLSTGCHERLIRDTDQDVYSVIRHGQQAALGETTPVEVEPVQDTSGSPERMYTFAPRPLDSEVPAAFRKRRATTEEENAEPLIDDAEGPPKEPQTVVEGATPTYTFDLRQALAYASLHARDLQAQRELLYLAALDLTLERHLWTPQFSATLSSEYEDYEQDDVLDQTLSTVAEVAVRQRLPLGGEIAARAIASFVNDVNEHVTTGESGQLILEADIPLFRGAGRTAYEDRYRAERNLIYAVRSYERFRRRFLVDVARGYFDVQQRKTAIRNTRQSYRSRREVWEKAEFIERMGRSKTVFEAPRAKSSLRDAQVALARANEEFESEVDQFKILIGMPVTELLDVLDQADDKASEALDALLADVPLSEAAEIALKFRLDLLNVADSVDDARRGVGIAKNRILPDLDFTGRLVSNSDPNHLSVTTQTVERTSWTAGLELRIDDRRTEIHDYRRALIDMRAAQRDYEEYRDVVRADVRRALRQSTQTDQVRRIQALNVEENAIRLEAAKVQFDLGKQTNQDVVDAESDLLGAQNQYAAALAAYRRSILEFRLSTGTLRVAEDGSWVEPVPPDSEGEPVPGP